MKSFLKIILSRLLRLDFINLIIIKLYNQTEASKLPTLNKKISIKKLFQNNGVLRKQKMQYTHDYISTLPKSSNHFILTDQKLERKHYKNSIKIIN